MNKGGDMAGAACEKLLESTPYVRVLAKPAKQRGAPDGAFGNGSKGH